jgi:hypothetical protein
MKKFKLIAVSTLAFAVITPAHAEKSDRVMIETMRSQILSARADIDASGAGRVELAEAESRLRDLAKALDDNEASDARASVNGIEALIAAARIRANAAARFSEAISESRKPAQVSAPVRKRLARRASGAAKPTCRIATR